MSQEKRVLLMDESILYELEEVCDRTLTSYLSNHEIYMISDDLSSLEKRSKRKTLPFQVQDIFPSSDSLDKMLYQAKFSNKKQTLLITKSPLKAYEAEQEGISTCFYNNGCNDFCSINTTYEIREAKQFVKVINKA